MLWWAPCVESHILSQKRRGNIEDKVLKRGPWRWSWNVDYEHFNAGLQTQSLKQNKYRSKHNKMLMNRHTQAFKCKSQWTDPNFGQAPVLSRSCSLQHLPQIFVSGRQKKGCCALLVSVCSLLLCNSPAVASKDLTVNQKRCQYVSTELKGYEKATWWIKLALNTFWRAAWLWLKRRPMSVVKRVLSTHPRTHWYICCHPARAKQHGWDAGLQGSQECNCERGELGWPDRVFSHNIPILKKTTDQFAPEPSLLSSYPGAFSGELWLWYGPVVISMFPFGQRHRRVAVIH